MATIEPRALQRIARDFSQAHHAQVEALLSSYDGKERDRVIWDILELSKGDHRKVASLVETASKDYRDILYWAEYYDDDPLVRGKDPKKLVDELLRKVRNGAE